jgi:hypothetical protein
MRKQEIKCMRFFITKNFLALLFKKSQQANRIISQARLSITHIMLFGWPCVAMSVYFSSTDERSKHGVEERNQKFLRNERSEYEPKANNFLHKYCYTDKTIFWMRFSQTILSVLLLLLLFRLKSLHRL